MDKSKKNQRNKNFFKRYSAVAGGLIAMAAVILMQNSGFSIDNIIVMIITIILLLTRKIPAPLIVIGVLIAGFIL